jgi:hypothetical protein
MSSSRCVTLRGVPLTAFLALAACGGSSVRLPVRAAPETAAPTTEVDSTQTTGVEVEAAPAPSGPPELQVPTECADVQDSFCAPSQDFVKRLCAAPHQTATLALFATTTPFTRLYLRGKLDELALDEEVLALARSRRASSIGIAGDHYDVLRWDGTCSLDVEAEMMTRRPPPRPRAAHVRWTRMAGPLQTSLIVSSETIKHANGFQGRQCMGASSAVTPMCGKAQDALSDAIVDYVRHGGVVPTLALND